MLYHFGIKITVSSQNYCQPNNKTTTFKSINIMIYKIIDITKFVMFQLNLLLISLKGTIFATPTSSTILVYLTYYAYICLGSILLPAKLVKGHSQPKRGDQLTYSINGFRLTILTIIIICLFGGLIPCFQFMKMFSIINLANQFWPLLSTVNIVAFTVSVLLYLKGKLGKSFIGEDVDTHSHGSFGLDFWIGRELNPRLGKFDIKFIAYRVSMIFWLVLNLSFLSKQITQQGQISYRMYAYQLCTILYVLDYFWNEQKMLTTWDIISQQFGYMLVFGNYVFIPFVFSIQCHYLIGYSDFQHHWISVLIVVVYFGGYYVFRTCNSQKNQFKVNPQLQIWGKKPQMIGGKLLISGFWGIGRHMNYTGDLIMAIAYCLPCGNQLEGYTYAIYLFILLTHRAYRDDTKCRKKYAGLWKEYTSKVRYVFLPVGFIDGVLTNFGKILYLLTNKEDVDQQRKEK